MKILIFLILPILALSQPKCFKSYVVTKTDSTIHATAIITPNLLDENPNGRLQFHGNEKYLKSFEGSGFDKGHILGAEFFAGDSRSYYESFSSENVVPQIPWINRGLIAQIEKYYRRKIIDVGCGVIHVTMKDFRSEKGFKIPNYMRYDLIDCSTFKTIHSYEVNQ